MWKVVAVIMVAFAAIYISLTAWSIVALRGAYAALERDGRPMKLADIMPPPIAETDNAAPLYEAALKILKTERIGDQTLMERLLAESEWLRTTNLTATAFTGFRAVIQTPAAVEALALIVQGGERKDCQFASVEIREAIGDWLGLQERMLISVDLLQLNQVVAWEARRLAVDGNASAARRMALAEMRLTRAHKGSPVLAGRLIEIAQRDAALRTVRILGTRNVPSGDEAKTLTRELARLDEPDLFARTMDCERLSFGDQSFSPSFNKTFHKKAGFRNRMAVRAYFSPLNPVSRLDHAAYLDVMRRQTTTALGVAQTQMSVPWWCRLTRIVAPIFEVPRRTFAEHLARVRCTEAGLAVLIHKRENGAWPETLAACMNPAPLDPFDGKPLRYRLTEKGFTVWSVGRTGKPPKEIAWDCEPTE